MAVTVKLTKVITEEVVVPVELGDTLVLGDEQKRLLIMGRDGEVLGVDTETFMVSSAESSIKDMVNFYTDTSYFGGIVNVIKAK